MKKIVILTHRPGRNGKLIRWLNMMFPECEIEAVCGHSQGLGYFPGVERDSGLAKESNNRKYPA